MIDRPFWAKRLAAAGKQASIVWLTGPRRVGKTVLARSLPDATSLTPSSANGNRMRLKRADWRRFAGNIQKGKTMSLAPCPAPGMSGVKVV